MLGLFSIKMFQINFIWIVKKKHKYIWKQHRYIWIEKLNNFRMRSIHQWAQIISNPHTEEESFSIDIAKVEKEGDVYKRQESSLWLLSIHTDMGQWE